MQAIREPDYSGEEIGDIVNGARLSTCVGVRASG